MAYVLGEPTVQQYFDANGDPLASGTIEFYVWDTSTPATIYSDSAGTAVGTSVTLNSLGAPANSGTAVALFFDTAVNYKIIRKDASGIEIDPTIGPYSAGVTSDIYTVTSIKPLIPADGDITRIVGANYDLAYKYDLASAATADGYVVIAPDSGTGRWIMVQRDTLPLSLYGETGALGSSHDSTANFDAALLACNTHGIDTLFIHSGDYYFNTLPSDIEFNVNIVGQNMFGTRLYKNFQSANNWEGVINIRDDGDGTQVRDLSVIATTGSASGVNGTGCNLSVYSVNSDADASISFVQITRCRFTTDGSSGNDRVKYEVYFDGVNANTGSVGLRACTITDCQIFGGELGSLWAKGTVSNTYRLTAANDAGGTTGLIHLGGDATVRSFYTILEVGVASSGVTIDFCDRVLMNIPNCDTVITTSDSQHVLLNTSEIPSTLTINDPDNFKLIQGSSQGATEYTIATGAIAITEYEKTANIIVDTEADAASDDLDTITGGALEQVIIVRTADAARDVTVTQNGNIRTSGTSRSLANNADSITLMWNGTNWLETAFSDAGST